MAMEGQLYFMPLLYACGKNQIELVNLLFDNNADGSIVDDKLHTPLMIACPYGQKAVAKIYLIN